MILGSLAANETEWVFIDFQAKYEVVRNNKIIGETTIELYPVKNKNWEFVTHTQGTKGLAAILNIDAIERSEFQWKNNRPQGLNYVFQQKSLLKNKQQSIVFNWSNNTAQSKNETKAWDVPLLADSMDRHLVVLAISADLKNREENFIYPVVDKDRCENKIYKKLFVETLNLPIGKLETIRIERDRRDNKNKRTTSWHAEKYDFLPVQIEQEELDKKEKITLRLVSMQR